MAELPSGTVTFLFTDIEGSTRLLKQLGERYATVLEQHHGLLREAFTAHGGQEIDTQGDALFVAFRRAKDAVAAAAAGQRALEDHAWPEDAVVRVRMGLHTGEPVVSPERYVGMGVHRGARICAAGHGGQVLLSNATRELIEDELPEGLDLRDLGEHKLKDIDRPERLFQLEIAGLPADFPPVRGVEAEVGPFGGHEEELEEAAVAAVGRFSRRGRLLAAGAAVVAIAGGAVLAVVLLGGGSSAHAGGIAANSVGLVGAGGDVDEQVVVESAPSGVAVSEGAIWVTNTNDASVSRVDPETGTVRQTILVGNGPSGIAAGAGSVWVANHDDGTLSRIDPATNTVVQTIRVGNGPTAVAFGEGFVWVTNADDRTLSKVNPRSGDAEAPIRTNAVSRGVAVGAGSVWVTDESTRAVQRVDPETREVTDTVNVGNGPAGLAFGAGSVWVANSLDGTVSRVDPSTLAVAETTPVGPGPAAVAATDEAVWVSVEFANRLVKIDPAGPEGGIASTVEVGNRPKGLAVEGEGVWVAVQAAGTGHRGGRLVVMAPALNPLDPAAGNSNFDVIAQGFVFDGLTALRRTGGAEGTQLVPDLAETLPTATSRGRTWRFRLRKGIHYSDGRLVHPADFRRGLERMIAAGRAGGATIAPDQWKVVGATACTTRRCDLARGVTVDGGTITFRLTEPNPRLPLLLAGVPPVPAGTPVRVGQKPVPGTGPYMVESYARGRGARFVRNPHFRVWSPVARPDGYADEIVWRHEPSEDRGVAALLRGAADVVPQSSPQKRLPELQTRYASLVHPVPQKATTFLFLNTRRPPFDDARVRQAVSFAIDRSKVASLHGGSELARPTCQYLPPSLPGFVGYCPYTASPDASGAWKAPDLERAKRLVAASGTRGAAIEVWTFPYFGQEARYTVSLLRRLGYRARLKEVRNLDDYFPEITETHPQAGFAGWFNTQLPSDVFGTLACNMPSNWAGFCDRGFDRRVERLRRTEVGEPEAAARLAARLDREAVDQAPWVALFTPQLVDVVSARVGNYQSNPYNGILLDQLWVR